jgi:hypothetical protein
VEGFALMEHDALVDRWLLRMPDPCLTVLELFQEVVPLVQLATVFIVCSSGRD